MYKETKGYLVYTDGRIEYGWYQLREADGKLRDIKLNGVWTQISADTPIAFERAEDAADYLRRLAATKYSYITRLGEEAGRCQANAAHLERTITGQ